MTRADFPAVFAAEHRRVYQLSLRMLGHRADAEEATQETFVAVLDALDGFRGECQLSTWIHRIALRTCVQLRARRPRHDIEVEALHDVLPSEENVERQAAAREEARRLMRAMAALPAEQRAVLTLSTLEGFKHAEVAELLGIAEGTVWSRLHAARRRLFELLDLEGEAKAPSSLRGG